MTLPSKANANWWQISKKQININWENFQFEIKIEEDKEKVLYKNDWSVIKHYSNMKNTFEISQNCFIQINWD